MGKGAWIPDCCRHSLAENIFKTARYWTLPATEKNLSIIRQRPSPKMNPTLGTENHRLKGGGFPSRLKTAQGRYEFHEHSHSLSPRQAAALRQRITTIATLSAFTTADKLWSPIFASSFP